MNCAKLRLHERGKPRAQTGRAATPGAGDRPRRFCQKRLVNPAHEEDPRWTDLYDRFYCNPSVDAAESTVDNIHTQPDDDLFLTVQNIKFDGDINQTKRPKTCFKYKAIKDGQKHRMFVKQVVKEKEEYIEDSSSLLTCYYFDDYIKYILNPDQNAASSDKSSTCGPNNNARNNTLLQFKSKHRTDVKTCNQINNNLQIKCKETQEVEEGPPDLELAETKVEYHKLGKRKCLTISRTQSPETVQVIRVDVVCHPHPLPHLRAMPLDVPAPDASSKQTHLDNQGAFHSKPITNMKTNHFTNKYLLTNTTKTLDENVSGGAKVTLLCKTFRLSSRNKPNNEKGSIRNNTQV
ncbi:uncharacterized protein LOC125241432 [Leguminivora glycinivorella]|uniref:uncharacterized protein LOC125241432 n=1 Tax=Leguminivora glycinivorella TaxID=1035111 RepID=UPI00200EB595|nr:uncharacterized protein LOC125241432 [Leguminivora glycinivorella]